MLANKRRGDDCKTFAKSVEKARIYAWTPEPMDLDVSREVEGERNLFIIVNLGVYSLHDVGHTSQQPKFAKLIHSYE